MPVPESDCVVGLLPVGLWETNGISYSIVQKPGRGCLSWCIEVESFQTSNSDTE